ncbi:MAG: helix-turn-helix domain-containing protein [Candidatus Coatesbacteria bacterium]|nr:helix-turn-helix domain-containing protein [Candidatus Coatesbacteria bacterium]
MEEQEILERLKLAMEKIGMKPSELARRCNVSRSYISQILSGVSKPRLRRILPAISNEINADWIISGRGHMLANEEAEGFEEADLSLAFKIIKVIKEEGRDLKYETKRSENFLDIPIISSTGTDVIDTPDKKTEFIRFPKSFFDTEDGIFFAMIIEEDDLYPNLCRGDIAIFRQQSIMEDGKIGIFAFPERDLYKKIVRIFDHKKNHIFLFCIDSKIEPLIFLPNDELHILGVLVLSIRKY